MTHRSGPIARALLAVIRGYRTYISPALPPSCRYSPSCSAYAAEAIGEYGAGRGTWLALRRLSRCHPFHAGGHDPVPPRVSPFQDPVAGASFESFESFRSKPRPARPPVRPAA